MVDQLRVKVDEAAIPVVIGDMASTTAPAATNSYTWSTTRSLSTAQSEQGRLLVQKCSLSRDDPTLDKSYHPIPQSTFTHSAAIRTPLMKRAV